MTARRRRPYPARRINSTLYYPKWGATTKDEANKRAKEFRSEGYWARVVKEHIKPNTIFRNGISYTVYVRHKTKGGHF